MGIGGGFLMTIWDAETKTAKFLNAKESAPKNIEFIIKNAKPNQPMTGNINFI